LSNVQTVESHGWSLNPGRYVGHAPTEDDGLDFQQRLNELIDEFATLGYEAHELQELILKSADELRTQP
jgi:type I restriction enzyme M protein